MATEKAKPIYPQILELPPGLSQQEFQRLVADRIRDLNQLIRGLGLNPSVADLSLGSFRITNLADPTDDLDAVNLRTLKRMGSTTTTSAPATIAPAPAVISNGGGGVALGPDGVPVSSTPVPPGTPVVTALPDPSVSTVGQQVIYNAAPYLFKDGLVGPSGYWSLDVTGSPSIRDTFANLSLYNPFSYAVGTVFFATDLLVSYAVQNTDIGKQWVYYNGICEALLANKPTGLDMRSRGLYFRASDYLHNWMWTGTAYSLRAAAQTGFAGGLLPGSTIFANPGPPFGNTGAFWQLCDGSLAIPVSQEDASLVNTDMPTIANTWFAR